MMSNYVISFACVPSVTLSYTGSGVRTGISRSTERPRRTLYGTTLNTAKERQAIQISGKVLTQLTFPHYLCSRTQIVKGLNDVAEKNM